MNNWNQNMKNSNMKSTQRIIQIFKRISMERSYNLKDQRTKSKLLRKPKKKMKVKLKSLRKSLVLSKTKYSNYKPKLTRINKNIMKKCWIWAKNSKMNWTRVAMVQIKLIKTSWILWNMNTKHIKTKWHHSSSKRE